MAKLKKGENKTEVQSFRLTKTEVQEIERKFGSVKNFIEWIKASAKLWRKTG